MKPTAIRHSNKKKLMIIHDFLIDENINLDHLAEKYNCSRYTAGKVTDNYFNLKTNLRPEALRLGSAEAFSEHFKNIKL